MSANRTMLLARPVVPSCGVSPFRSCAPPTHALVPHRMDRWRAANGTNGTNGSTATARRKPIGFDRTLLDPRYQTVNKCNRRPVVQPHDHPCPYRYRSAYYTVNLRTTAVFPGEEVVVALSVPSAVGRRYTGSSDGVRPLEFYR